MIYLIEYVFQIKQKIFNMITGKNESKFLSRDICHANVNLDLMEKM